MREIIYFNKIIMKKYLPIFFFFLILNHAQSQFTSGTNTWTSYTNFTLGSGSYSTGYGAIAFGYQSSAYSGVGIGYSSYASGTGSVSIGYSNYSYGNGTTSLGYDNTAQSSYSTSIGYSNYVSSATGGVAIGYDNDTRNSYGISIGYSNFVNGTGAAALGYDNSVSGAYAVALGRSNSASGHYSTAMGYDTTVSDYASTVIGQYNSSGSSATSASSFSTSNPAFVIGNGTSSGSLSDAFKVMFNGDAYISSSLYLGGTAVTSTAAEINYVDGVTSNVQTQLDSKQATITGAATTIATDDLTVSRALTSNGSGKVEVSAVTSTELGYLDGVSSNIQTQLNAISSSADINGGAIDGAAIGANSPSTAVFTTVNSTGTTTLASGGGVVNIASTGEMTTVKGTLNVDEAVTLDNTLDVTGDTSVSTFDSTGATTLASGGGVVNVASSGVMTTVKGTLNVDEAVTLDTNLDVSGALSIGGTTVTSTAAELNYVDGVTSNVQTQLDSKLSSSGNITTGGNIIIPDSGNIGSTSDTDAITIANSGNVTFGQDVTVNGDVVISSDERLKSNIVSLGSTLSKLLLIDGKSYEMKGKQKIGVLAQEIQEVFPELVSEDDNEMLAVNYQGLLPVLINALKEQDEKINRLEILVETLIKNE